LERRIYSMLHRLTKAIPIVLLLMSPVWSIAVVTNETFKLSGSGGYAISPAEFDGSIYAGTLSPGTFIIEIDDVIWPVDNPGTPQNERWQYIFANYFHYDNSQPGAEKWTAYFPPLPIQIPVVTFSYQRGADRVGGILQSMIVTISDANHNGIVDSAELNVQAVAGNLVAHIEQCEGVYEGFCGAGSMNGTLEGYGIGAPYVITVSTGNLLLRDFGCTVGVDHTTWGAVKQIYSE
jgi:hypothetical protein